MKTTIHTHYLLFALNLISFTVGSVSAGSGTWLSSPASSDWNTAANWSSTTVPNGPADTATFGSSSISAVSISDNIEVNTIVFNPLAQLTPFDITVTPPGSFPPTTLTISGVGIANNSGVIQNFFADRTPFGELASIVFENKATAGEMTAFTSASAGRVFMVFNATSTAGAATINNNNSLTEFNAMSNAANATINNSTGSLSGIPLGGELDFNGSSSAGNATINNAGPTFSAGEIGTQGGRTNFFDSSTASSATIIADGATVQPAHELDSFGFITFTDTSTAGNATLIANGGTNGGDGGLILFFDRSTGGTARVEVFGNGRLIIAGSEAQPAPEVTIGSLEGTGLVSVRQGNLTVGSNNLSTVFSGVMQGGFSGGTGGSLTKIGTGTLTLSGANTYFGDTTVNGGVLRVNGSIASPNTFVNRGGTLSGTGTVGGNLNNNEVVAPGDSPGTLHVGGNYSQGSDGVLDIEIASLFSFDQLMVSGTAALSGTLDVSLDGYAGHAGDMFTILTSSGLSGNFLNLDLPTLSDGLFFTERVTSNDVILTVSGSTSVPDQGSTLLLMASALGVLFGIKRVSNVLS